MRYSLTIALSLLLTGCAIGPDYKKPLVSTPPVFRGAENQAASEASVADTKWPELFQDPVLKDLVETALRENFDARVAAERILQAQAQLGITRAQFYPQLTGTAAFTSNRQSRVGSIPFAPPGARLDVGYTQLSMGVSWELDLWGRIRRLNEAAKAQYLSTQEAKNAVTTALVGDVTSGYFTLRSLDLQLEIARKTTEIAENGLRLTKLRRDRGVATGLDVSQAEQLFFTAHAQIAASEREITQSENALNLLLGRNPGSIQRGKALREFAVPAQLPPGLPSTLLARRPDIRRYEQELIAANARIGAARALYFPQISLTSLLGTQSRALTNLFTDPAKQASFAPSAVAPIFDAGRIRNNVRLSQSQQREALIQYERTVRTAFKEVSDALVAYEKTREQRGEQEKLVGALNTASRLSSRRYEGGLDSYLQVLDAQRNQFQGELSLTQLQLLELNSIVQLYRALGGGWQ